MTNAYHEADTKAERAKIHKQVETVRAESSAWVDKDTLVEIDNVSVYYKQMNQYKKEIQSNNDVHFKTNE